MTIYTRSDVESMNCIGHAEPMLFRVPESMLLFVSRLFKQAVCEEPLQYGLQVACFIATLIWGIAADHWRAFILFTIASVFWRGHWVMSCVRFYRMIRERSWQYRIDKYGISIVVECDNGQFVRIGTDSWDQVMKMYIHHDCVVLEMDKSAEGAEEYILFTDKQTARTAILTYWQRTLRGVSPDDLPDVYSNTEDNEVKRFIEANFGKIRFIGGDFNTKDLPISLAIIEPTDQRPYYTVCSIGAGAYRMNVPRERREEYISEYNEYVIHLPSYWNVLGKGCGEWENWWATYLPRECGRITKNENIYFGIGHRRTYEEPFDIHTDACCLYLNSPLPDMSVLTRINLSTGSTVNFLQIIPLDENDVRYFDANTDFVDCCRNILGIDFDVLDNATPEERKLMCEQKILAHFSKLMKGTHPLHPDGKGE